MTGNSGADSSTLGRDEHPCRAATQLRKTTHEAEPQLRLKARNRRRTGRRRRFTPCDAPTNPVAALYPDASLRDVVTRR